MKEWQNPFDILGATPWDNRHRLASLAQDAALLVGETETQETYTALLNPEKRLMAEVQWTDGKKHGLYEAFKALGKTLRKDDVQQSAGMIAELCKVDEAVQAETLTLKINNARMEAGFRPVRIGEVQEALNASTRGMAQMIAQNLRSDARLGQMILTLTEQNEQLALSHLTQRLAAEYELRAAAKAEEEREKILARVQKLNAGGRMNVAWETGRLCQHIDRWNQLVLPIRKLRAACALPHEPSIGCFYEARAALEMLCKKLRSGKLSCQLTHTLRDCFSDIEELQETICKDCELVGELYEMQKHTIQKNRKELVIAAIVCAVCLPLALLSGPEEGWKVAVGLLCVPLAWLIHRGARKNIE